MILNGVLVAFGAFLGATSRFAVSKWIDNKMTSKFPFGTIAVNLLGSFLLGIIIASQGNNQISLLLGTGFMGSFTTFSTFKVESIKLGLEKRWYLLSRYLIYSYGLGIVLAFFGYFIGKQLYY